MVKLGFISSMESIVHSQLPEVTVLQSPEEKENVAEWKIEKYYIWFCSLLYVYMFCLGKSQAS